MPQNKEFKRTIYYLGNKAKSAKKIDLICAQLFGKQSSVLDLFAGSGGNSRQFSVARRVVANDIQMYSYIINSAILTKSPYSEIDIFTQLRKHDFFEKTSKIKHQYRKLISFENKLIEKGNDEDVEIRIRHLSLENQFINSTNLSQRCVLVDHFGGLYFSYEQACELQALLQIVEELTGTLKTQFLATVLSTASRLSNTIGNQFAQPLKLLDKGGKIKNSALLKLRKDRAQSTISIFKKCIGIYTEIDVCSNDNICRRLLDSNALKEYASNVDFVYADPPYGREHYSRFYHVLETIARNDCPAVTSYATMIRNDRYQSDFCIKSKVEYAFDKMFCAAKKHNTPLVLSYADQSSGTKKRSRVLPIKKIEEIAFRHYNSVQTHIISNRNYSQMNKTSLASEHRASREVLLIAT